MTLIFADKTRITTTGNVTTYLFRHHPQYVDEWLAHKERFDYEMRKVEAWLQWGKEVAMANLTPEQIYRLQSILEAENNHDLVRGLGLNKSRKSKPKKSATPKQKRAKETTDFTFVFGGGLVLTLVLAYLGVEFGIIKLNF